MTDKTHTYHHGDLRAALIAESLQMLESDGISAISLRALGERLGVSRSAAYRHFTDKAELLACVAEQGFRQFRFVLHKASSDTTQPVLEQFKAMGQAYVQFALDNSACYQLMFHQTGILNNAHPSLREAADLAFGELLSILERCQKAGVVKREDVQAQAIFVWSSMHGLSSLLLAQRLSFCNQKDIQDFMEIHIMKGIGRGLRFL